MDCFLLWFKMVLVEEGEKEREWGEAEAHGNREACGEDSEHLDELIFGRMREIPWFDSKNTFESRKKEN